jgi:hypothetical protein
MTAAYPLHWPEQFPRTEKPARNSAFRTSLAGALKNVREELRRFAKDSDREIASVVISSNVTLGDDNPRDAGVAVWFHWDGAQVCVPIDRYDRVEANLQAIALVLEARRTELRHGGLAIVRATFRGFAALPSPQVSADWRKVLRLPIDGDRAAAEAAFKRLALEKHPDKPGGSHEAMAELNQAIAAARRHFGG